MDEVSSLVCLNVGCRGDCVAKLLRSGRTNFLTVTEAFDVFGLGETHQPRPIHSAVLSFVFKKVSLTKTGGELTFARILLRRYFLVLQHNPPDSGRERWGNRPAQLVDS